jgi:Ribbon-helix-helix domain
MHTEGYINMQRITVNITEEQSDLLKKHAALTGIPQSEQIRRGIECWQTLLKDKLIGADSVMALVRKPVAESAVENARA